MLVILGVFRFGFLDSLLSRPLLSGFINAVALIIMLEQLDILFGIPDPTKHYWQKLLHVLHRVDKANWNTFLIGETLRPSFSEPNVSLLQARDA